jgi:hypothetical protein
VVQAGGADEGARAALRELCAAYYAPVVSFLRSEGREEDPARELAHEFFARVLAGASLHMSAGAVKVAIHRLRQRFRESVKLEIAQTVPVTDDVEDELRYLATVLAL